ncbi:MAG: Pseudaminic acid CMP-transferase [uncultured Sulfurovum sp.]|uniref:Pseudaminic acid CMP-transferase n=1 Tax=uncultured Sulfurovum sp. TaxID=269237 RepID=A0A6S6TFX5_9BACT|nr:MAG: Pseudaminic acid CMP-transferase [uncultured Sulfurovum sp.]
MSISIVLPIRKGSQRVKNKNIRPFSKDGKSLTELKIIELLKIKEVDEIVVTSNYDEAIEQIEAIAKNDPRVKIDRRPEHLCTPTTNVKELIEYMPTITTGEHILWLHVTSPFVKAEDYQQGIKKYFEALEEGRDSIMSVTEIKQFLWSDREKKIINANSSIESKWVQTQDLEPLYEINHAFYINSRENYLNTSDRIGSNPYLYVLKGSKVIDIDWEEDFELASKIFNI